MPPILTITLNPALDVSTETETLRPGPKLRCAAPRMDPGGGGANVSRALRKFGAETLAFIAIGGPFGEAYRALAEAEGLPAAWHETQAETRQSLSVTETATGGQYRFILPGAPWTEAAWRAALTDLTARMQPGGIVVLSGSQPPGLPDDAPRTLAKAAAERGARLVIDTSGEALRAAERPGAGAYVLRMDREEAQTLAGLARIEGPQAEALARRMVSDAVAEIVIITVGGDGAVAASAQGAWHAVPPATAVVSATGAGDSFVAGLCARLAEGTALPEALAFAAAAAASAVETPATELCTLGGTRAKLAGVTVRAL